MSVERVDVRMGMGELYALYVDYHDITVYDGDDGDLIVDSDVSIAAMEEVEEALGQALDVVRASHAERFVGRRVRQKYNITRAEDGSETFDYYDGLVKDAEWSDELQRYTLAILCDVDDEMEYNVEVDEYVEFLDEAVQA